MNQQNLCKPNYSTRLCLEIDGRTDRQTGRKGSGLHDFNYPHPMEKLGWGESGVSGFPDFSIKTRGSY